MNAQVADYPYTSSTDEPLSNPTNAMTSSYDPIASLTSGLQSAGLTGTWPLSATYGRVGTVATNIPGPQTYPALGRQHQLLYSNILNDGLFEQYAMQQYSLSESQQVSGTNTQQDFPSIQYQQHVRHYPQRNAPIRPLHARYPVDQDMLYDYNNTGMSFVGSSAGSACATTDSPSGFPALASLASSLPAPHTSFNSARVLPVPASSSSLSVYKTSLASNSGNDTDAIVAPANRISNDKSLIPWGPERATTGGSQVFTATTLDSPNNMCRAAGSSTSPSPTDNETTLGYVITRSPTSANDEAAPGYPTSGMGSSGTSQGIPTNDTSITYASGNSGDPLLRPQETSNWNSYSFGSRTEHNAYGGNGSSDGLLLSGQPYTLLRQMAQPSSYRVDAFRHDSQETETAKSQQRSSVSSISQSQR